MGLLLAAVTASPAAGYTSESPEVRQMVEKGVAFLEGSGGNDPRNRMGAKALVAMAVLKAGRSPNDPRIVDAVNTIQSTVHPGFDPATLGEHRFYEVSMTCIFLVELDAQKYANQINILLRTLQTNQKPWGAWGYPAGYRKEYENTSDTSMTQYGVLAVWEASKADFDVPGDMKERPLTWLLRTQDPSGGWGYQGRVSPNFSPIPQEEQTPSLTVAGLSSVYACADLLGLADPLMRRLPALVRVDGPGDGASQVTPAQVFEVAERGNRWMERNYTIHPKLWTYYYLYGLERCSSFRDLIEGKVGEKREASPQVVQRRRRFSAPQPGERRWLGCGRSI